MREPFEKKPPLQSSLTNDFHGLLRKHYKRLAEQFRNDGLLCYLWINSVGSKKTIAR